MTYIESIDIVRCPHINESLLIMFGLDEIVISKDIEYLENEISI
jgi:hypothetical protein